VRMPRRRNRRKNRMRAARRGRRGGMQGAGPLSGPGLSSVLVAPSSDSVHELLRTAVFPKETKDGWQLLAKRSDEKSPEPVVKLRLLRGVLFKPDQPFRTKLGNYANLLTSAAGAMNTVYNVSNISSASEWSSINQLFDEVFVHSMTVEFTPRNVLGGGVGASGSMTQAIATVTTATTVSNGFTVNCGLILACLFHGAGFYTTAQAMLANPTRAVKHSWAPWRYVWRNNERFDPRGPGMSSGTSEAWQGWGLITNTANMGGLVQVRAADDVVMGDGTHALVLGDVAVLWDISLRARA